MSSVNIKNNGDNQKKNIERKKKPGGSNFSYGAVISYRAWHHRWAKREQNKAMRDNPSVRRIFYNRRESELDSSSSLL